MSTQYQYAPGRFHIQVKLHGDPKRILLFHAILRDIESDWCFYRRHSNNNYSDRIVVCKLCKGIIINNTRLAPQDIKAAATQCGIGCKIYNFAKEEKCGNGTTRGTESIDREYAEVLWSHKPGRIHVGGCKAWVGDAPAGGRVIEMPGRVEVVQ